MKKVLSLVLSVSLVLSMAACTPKNGTVGGANDSGGSVNESGGSVNGSDNKVNDSGGSVNNSGNRVVVSGVRTSFADDVTLMDYEVVEQPQVRENPVMEDLSNVINAENFSMFFEYNPQAKEQLLKNGFVVVPGYNSEYFSLYEGNRYSFTPNFITTDSMLHTFHLYFSHLLKGLEQQYFYDNLIRMCEGMIEETAKQYEQVKGTSWENAALRNMAYYSVALKLLDEGAPVDPRVQDLVAEELALIQAQNSIEYSPLMNWENVCDDPLMEDYTQYKVRGYYEENETLSRYFQAMMWFGRITFRVSSEEETKSAVLITKAMENAAVYENWNRVYDITSFFMGESDDPGFYEYYSALDEVYGAADVKNIASDEKTFGLFKAKLMTMDPPAINSIPVYEFQDKDSAIVGFRVMGQRENFDAVAFGQLVYQNVTQNSMGQYRMLPSAMDIPAVFGSSAAEDILRKQGAMEYGGYEDNLHKLQSTVADAGDEVWNSSLYSSWIGMLRPLTEVKGEGYPKFMQNKAWTYKQLNTFLGSFAELKHDSVLYAKQVYAEMGGGAVDEPDYRGYVEPETEVYARLANLALITREGLKNYGVLTAEDADNLSKVQEVAEKLVVISNKELKGENLTEEEHDFIKSYGGQLEHFWYEALKDQAVDGYLSPANHPAAIVTDIATNPNGRVLEIGTGNIDSIYVIVDVEGSLRISCGGVYSFYEFEEPMDHRLTDKDWRLRLGIDFPEDEKGNIIFDNPYKMDVEQPEWVKEFKVVK